MPGNKAPGGGSQHGGTLSPGDYPYGGGGGGGGDTPPPTKEEDYTHPAYEGKPHIPILAGPEVRAEVTAQKNTPPPQYTGGGWVRIEEGGVEKYVSGAGVWDPATGQLTAPTSDIQKFAREEAVELQRAGLDAQVERGSAITLQVPYGPFETVTKTVTETKTIEQLVPPPGVWRERFLATFIKPPELKEQTIPHKELKSLYASLKAGPQYGYKIVTKPSAYYDLRRDIQQAYDIRYPSMPKPVLGTTWGHGMETLEGEPLKSYSPYSTKELSEIYSPGEIRWMEGVAVTLPVTLGFGAGLTALSAVSTTGASVVKTAGVGLGAYSAYKELKYLKTLPRSERIPELAGYALTAGAAALAFGATYKPAVDVVPPKQRISEILSGTKVRFDTDMPTGTIEATASITRGPMKGTTITTDVPSWKVTPQLKALASVQRPKVLLPSLKQLKEEFWPELPDEGIKGGLDTAKRIQAGRSAVSQQSAFKELQESVRESERASIQVEWGAVHKTQGSKQIAVQVQEKVAVGGADKAIVMGTKTTFPAMGLQRVRVVEHEEEEYTSPFLKSPVKGPSISSSLQSLQSVSSIQGQGQAVARTQVQTQKQVRSQIQKQIQSQIQTQTISLRQIQKQIQSQIQTQVQSTSQLTTQSTTQQVIQKTVQNVEQIPESVFEYVPPPPPPSGPLFKGVDEVFGKRKRRRAKFGYSLRKHRIAKPGVVLFGKRNNRKMKWNVGKIYRGLKGGRR